MQVYQEEEGQVGLIFGIVLTQDDLKQILKHNPLNIKIGLLRINISFCEPSKPLSFDADKKVYFIPLCRQEIKFLRDGSSLVVVNVIEGVQFILNIFLMEHSQCMVLDRSELE